MNTTCRGLSLMLLPTLLASACAGVPNASGTRSGNRWAAAGPAALQGAALRPASLPPEPSHPAGRQEPVVRPAVPAKSAAPVVKKTADIRIEGEIGRSPFGCTMVRTADGGHYSLAREIEGTSPGQTVWVEGYLIKSKSCMPGHTLMPRRAGIVAKPAAAKMAPARPAGGG